MKSALVKRLSRLFKRTNSSNSISCAFQKESIIYIYIISLIYAHTQKLFNCSFVRLVEKSAYFKGVTDFQANEQFEQFFQVRLNEGRMEECFFM